MMTPKPKQGRPRFDDEPRNQQVNLKLTPTMLDNVSAAAKREGVSRNQWLNLAVAERLASTPAPSSAPE
jgi:transposase-like protein